MTNPLTTTAEDPRKPAWDGVYAYIRALPFSDAELNALIWGGVDAALVGLGYPSAYQGRRPAPDTARTAGHATGGYVRALRIIGEDTPGCMLPTRTDTVRTLPGQPSPDNWEAPQFPFRFRPAAIRLSVLGTSELPTAALVAHLPEPDPFTDPDTDPWAVEGRIDTTEPYLSARPGRPGPLSTGGDTVVLDIALSADDCRRFLSMCTGPGYPPPMRAVVVELWAPAPVPGR